MGLKLHRVDVYLNLAISAAVRLWDRSALYVRNLVADLELRDVFELGFVETPALQGNQADGLAGSIHAQDNGWQSPRRQPAQVGQGEVGDVAKRSVGVSAWFEINFDQADAGERARLGVIDVCAQSEEALECVRNIRFDLLRRHAVVKGGNDDYRYVDLGKEIDRHAEHVEDADQHDHQAEHDDEVGVFEGKLGHYWSPPWSSCKSIMLSGARVMSPAGVGVKMGWTNSPS